MASTNVLHLAGVIYSAGKVFDGLQSGRLATESFLRDGSLEGITSRSDVALLTDLQTVAQLVLDRTSQFGAQLTLDARLLIDLNGSMTESASIEPGQLRRDDQRIGVSTSLGRHEPPALSSAALEQIIHRAIAGKAPADAAVDLFIEVAKAQPFMDGNKRTALFAANALLISSGSGKLLTIPVSDDDPSVAKRFTEKLAHAYVRNDHEPVRALLQASGVIDDVRAR